MLAMLLVAQNSMVVVAIDEDPYKVLGVEKDATAKEIKRAFRKLALKYHPDRNPSKDAETEFIRIAAAYELLDNKEKRQQYDSNPNQPYGNGFEDNFDYKQFFSKFDAQMRRHHQMHAQAVKEMMGEAAAKLNQEHMKIHQKAMRQAQLNAKRLAAQASGQELQVSMEDIDWDGVFEDTTEDEDAKYSEHAKTNEGAVQSDNCKTVVTKTKDGVSTETICSETHEEL